MHKSVDYLKELRIKREQEGGVKKPNQNDFIEKYLNDPTLNDYQKLDIIKRKAEIMERKAKMDEQLIKVGKGSVEGKDDVDKTIAVNDMYIEAITAKLKILDQI